MTVRFTAAHRGNTIRALKTAFCFLLLVGCAFAQGDPLPSWNDGPAKQAILQFVQVTTDASNPKFVPPEQRIAAFDQDGTTWVEQPIYPQWVFAFEQVKAFAAKHPKIKTAEPFKTVLSGNLTKVATLNAADLERVLVATHPGMTVEQFQAMVKSWIATAKHPRFDRPYTELVYQPMLEVMRFLRANGYKTFFVTGDEQDFVRAYSSEVYAIPPEQVVGSIGATKYGYTTDGKAVLTKLSNVILTADRTGKAEGIQLIIGQRPIVAFGNSGGDEQMLEYTQGGDGPRLMLLMHHDDALREYAYGPESNVGRFSDALMAEAKKRGWIVISMKNDWNRIFAFDK
jgi:hypothetical protein